MKKILIVVDYQYDFVNGVLQIPGADLIAKNIQTEINNDIYENIIYTFDTHIPIEYNNSEEQKLFNDIHCEYKTKGWELFNIIPRNNNEFLNQLDKQEKPFDIININKEFFFCKNKFDIWTGNPIYENWFLNKFNNKEYEFYITGVATEYCVNMNIAGLIKNNYKVNILTNCIKAIDDNNGIITLNNIKEKVNII